MCVGRSHEGADVEGTVYYGVKYPCHALLPPLHASLQAGFRRATTAGQEKINPTVGFGWEAQQAATAPPSASVPLRRCSSIPPLGYQGQASSYLGPVPDRHPTPLPKPSIYCFAGLLTYPGQTGTAGDGEWRWYQAGGVRRCGVSPFPAPPPSFKQSFRGARREAQGPKAWTSPRVRCQAWAGQGGRSSTLAMAPRQQAPRLHSPPSSVRHRPKDHVMYLLRYPFACLAATQLHKGPGVLFVLTTRRWCLTVRL